MVTSIDFPYCWDMFQDRPSDFEKHADLWGGENDFWTFNLICKKKHMCDIISCLRNELNWTSSIHQDSISDLYVIDCFWKPWIAQHTLAMLNSHLIRKKSHGPYKIRVSSSIISMRPPWKDNCSTNKNHHNMHNTGHGGTGCQLWRENTPQTP